MKAPPRSSRFFLKNSQNASQIPADFKEYFLHVPVDQETSCQDCHKLDSTPVDYRRMNVMESNCQTEECHGGMGDDKYVHGPVGSGTCIACHNPHGSLEEYEVSRSGLPLCLICHEDKEEELKQEHVHGIITSSGCIDCHDSHESPSKFQLVAAITDQLCFNCHDDSKMKLQYVHGPVGDGKDFSFASLNGKIAIIVFWRAEQERSIQALLALQEIYTEFKEQDVEVLALSSDEDGLKPISEIKQSRQLTFTMLYDKDQKAYGDYGVIGIPSTFVIDKEGKLSYYCPGYRSDYTLQIKGHLEVLLGKKTAEQLQLELKPNEKPEVSEAEKKARRYLNAGNRLLEKRMSRPAMVKFQKAVQEYPALPEPHLHLGDIYLAQKKTEDAAIEFGKVIELEPESAEARKLDGPFVHGPINKG